MAKPDDTVFEDEEDNEQPTIRFGDSWIPAPDAWKKMETATVVTDAIDRFNTDFPHLATDETRAVVPLVRQRLKDIEVRMPKSRAEMPSLADAASELLQTLPPEDVLEMLREKHGAEISLRQLVQLVGDTPYLQSLGREAREFTLNRISPPQTADLWNDARRPAPGGGLWTAKKVERLLAEYGG
jgi:hypothetical protein